MQVLSGKDNEIVIQLTAGDADLSSILKMQEELSQEYSITYLMDTVRNYLLEHGVNFEKVDNVISSIVNAEKIRNEIFLAQELVAQFGEGYEAVSIKNLIESAFINLDGENIMSPVSGIADKSARMKFLDDVLDAHTDIIPGVGTLSFVADFIKEFKKEDNHLKMADKLSDVILSKNYINSLSAEFVNNNENTLEASLAKELDKTLQNTLQNTLKP